MTLEDRIKKHEGCRTKPYKCSQGFLTVGYGRNLDVIPFNKTEIDLMFKYDLQRARAGAETFPVYEFLNEARQGVLIEMVFQLGVNGVHKFKNFLSAALQCKWAVAANEMLDSKWHKQTRKRCELLADIFERGYE